MSVHKSAVPFKRWTQGGPSYAECGAALGVSAERVRQIEVSALQRLRRCLDLLDDGMSVDVAVEQCRARRPGRPRKRVTR